jgi:hypothetical protein
MAETNQINCPHMTGTSICTICKELDHVRQELADQQNYNYIIAKELAKAGETIVKLRENNHD